MKEKVVSFRKTQRSPVALRSVFLRRAMATVIARAATPFRESRGIGKLGPAAQGNPACGVIDSKGDFAFFASPGKPKVF